jgi:hypothetical protein
VIDVDRAPYTGGNISLGLALDPTGGYVVGTVFYNDNRNGITVQRVRP